MIGPPFATALDADGPASTCACRLPTATRRVFSAASSVRPSFRSALSRCRGGGGWVSALEEGALEIGSFRVAVRRVPLGRSWAYGLRVSDGRVDLAYLPDHDAGVRGSSAAGGSEDAAIRLCRDARVLIHNARHAPGEETAARATGHSTVADAVMPARAAGVRRHLLTRHHRERTDADVERLAIGPHRRGPHRRGRAPGRSSRCGPSGRARLSRWGASLMAPVTLHDSRVPAVTGSSGVNRRG